MKFERTHIPDVVVCTPLVFTDHRGYFYEAFQKEKLEAFLGHSTHFVQENVSKSSAGVIRGLHYQLPPHAQTKLVRVVKGTILDVVVDIRKNSPTFLQQVTMVLSDENNKQLYIPKGFAHGFSVLSEEAIVSYKIDTYYHQASERCIHYADPTLQIDWQVAQQHWIVSQKDAIAPMLSEATLFES